VTVFSGFDKLFFDSLYSLHVSLLFQKHVQVIKLRAA
jgi:hypothetical protein